MRQPLDEKLEVQRDKRERRGRSRLPRIASIATVLALFASLVLIVVGAVSIARRRSPKDDDDPVAASLAGNSSQSQAEEQLRAWRSQIFDVGGRLDVHGASTSAIGDAVRFDGQLFVAGAGANWSQDGKDMPRIDGVVQVVLHQSPRGRFKGRWQPRSYSFAVAMLNSSAYSWKSVRDRGGSEYLVSEACVQREDAPTFVQAVVNALLLPANKRQIDLVVDRSFAPEGRQSSTAANSTKDDAVRLSTASKSFNLWQLNRNYVGSADDDSTASSSSSSSSSSSNATRKIWMLTGGNVTVSLRLGDSNSDELADAVVVPRMMLADYRRAFRSCPSLFNTRSSTTVGSSSRANEKATVAGASEDEESADAPLPLQKWAKAMRSSLPSSQENRRLSIPLDIESAGGDSNRNETTLFMTTEKPSPAGPMMNATKCVDGRKKCLFVHGIGIHEDIGLVNNFTDYWGEQVMMAFPCCSELKFTHLNTVDRPWYSLTLARATCAAAVAVATNTTFQFPTTDDDPSANSSERIRDMVVVSHSSGVLNVASALMHGYCSLSPESSKWIAIQGPILGSRTANNVVTDCGKPKSGWDSTVKRVLTAFDLCPAKNSTHSLVRNGTDLAGPCLDGLYTRAAVTFRASVNASLCGVSADGISSSDSRFYSALAEFSGHEDPEENDGAVSFDSCRGGFPASKYRSTFESAFYKAALNHADGRLVHGDAWSKDQQPVRWLQRQIL